MDFNRQLTIRSFFSDTRTSVSISISYVLCTINYTVKINSTVLSKQIKKNKEIALLNLKQVDSLITDRNAIKAHGLTDVMKF